MTTIDELAGAAHLLVALDFDGTLAPIVPRAEMARILLRAAQALARLHRLPQTTLAIVSGRDLSELVKLVPEPERFWLGGSHGRTLIPPGERRETTPPNPRLKFFQNVPLLPGIRREIKEFSVAFHWRGRTGGEPTGWISSLRTNALQEKLEVLDGRMVLEILIPGAGKEVALREVADTSCANAIFFAGDDRTDLEAIQFANARGIGIFVTSAERPWMAPPDIATVDGPEELAEWLHRLADLRGVKAGMND